MINYEFYYIAHMLEYVDYSKLNFINININRNRHYTEGIIVPSLILRDQVWFDIDILQKV